MDGLMNGGYILYVRHAEANVGVDLPGFSFGNCLTQRNLSNNGRMQAMMFGEYLRHKSIPIAYPILASPFCRAIETANLAFGAENVQISPFLIQLYRLSGVLSEFERESILNTLEGMLETKPSFRNNQVIIGHNFPKGVGLGDIPDMGTVVVESRGRGRGYNIVARISLNQWM
ncbi:MULTISPECIES: histidine phosphatase family protein [unclassified Sutcliffiella]|uniref:histidine phosphatase family protein n=1 Tax=unclassified Sutcliffiella TaxID=2837532 RepID=UPI0030CD6C3E